MVSERRCKLGGRGEVIFDRVAKPHDLGVLQPRDHRYDRLLNVARQARRYPVAVILEGVSSLGLEKNLVCLAVGEADDLVFDRRTVPRTGALDLARIHRCAVKVGSDHIVHCSIGVGDVAVELRLRQSLREEREGHRLGVSRLWLQAAEVDRPPVQPRWRAGLESQQLESQAAQALRKPDRSPLAAATTGRLHLAGVHQCLKKRACREHDGPGVIPRIATANHPGDPPVLDPDRVNHFLPERKPRLAFDCPLGQELIGLLVALGPRAVHSRPFAPVE